MAAARCSHSDGRRRGPITALSVGLQPGAVAGEPAYWARAAADVEPLWPVAFSLLGVTTALAVVTAVQGLHRSRTGPSLSMAPWVGAGGGGLALGAVF